MSHFRKMNFGGTSYDLSHLDPFKLGIRFEGNAYTALVMFSCHCFTEAFDAGRHDDRVIYEHRGEKRAFNVVRYQHSRSLPALFRTLGNRTVYHTKRRSFFFVRKLAHETASIAPPYVVFFKTQKANMVGADAIVNVVSAYPKPGMTLTASPVKFPRIIDSTVRGRPLPLGPVCRVRRH